MLLNKDIAYFIKRKIRDSLTVCRFNQVCRAANLHELKTLANGKRYAHGLRKSYYENGKLWYEGTYKDNKLYGLWKIYYKNGQLESEGTWKDGKPHGLRKSYHKNGQLKSEGTWKDGKLHGLWKEYHADGQLYSETYHGELEN